MMASFKDVLIKDSKSGSSRRQINLSSVDEKMEEQSIPADRRSLAEEMVIFRILMS